MTKLFLICVLLSTFANNLHADDAIKIQVYYETLCPDSIKFITKQLYPTVNDLGTEWINLELIPYGHASEDDSNDTKHFTCQHGPDECYGNKVHSCVIHYPATKKTVDFINCGEGSGSPANPDALQKCAETVDISWLTISNCLSSGLADELLSENGKKTDKLNPKFIPTIVFNDTFNQDDQDAALSNLEKVVCEKLANAADGCKK